MNVASVVITHARVGFEMTQSPYVTHAPVVTTVHSLVQLARVGRYYFSDVASVLNLVHVSLESHTTQISKPFRLSVV